MARQKFLVRLVRPVFQTAYVEVEGRDENEAACTAFTSAYQLPEEEWKGRFDPEEYLFDVHCVRSGETSEGHAFSLMDFPKYSLLSSSESPHIGNSSSQPWMNDLHPTTVAAMFSQWIDQLIEERGGYYEEAIDFFEERLRFWRGSDEKVVPLMPPAERRLDIEMVEAVLETLRLLKEVD